MLMETMGQVDESAMICRNSAFIGAVNNWTMLLTRNHTTVRKANLPTLSLVMALELLFTNAEASLFILSGLASRRLQDMDFTDLLDAQRFLLSDS